VYAFLTWAGTYVYLYLREGMNSISGGFLQSGNLFFLFR